MTALGVVACALLGIPVGVFVNLVIERVPAKERLRPLPPLGDLARSPQQVGVIAATSALFAGTALRFGADWVVPAYLVFFSCLVAVTVIDFRLKLIPNRIVYPTAFVSIPLLALAALAGGEWGRFGQALLGATLALGAAFVLWLVNPAGMGFGDVRFSFVLGLFLGWISLGHVLVGLMLGNLLLVVVGLGRVVLGRASMKSHLAFGPFLALGAAIAVFAGQPITRWWPGG